jgi:hypothetical protein
VPPPEELSGFSEELQAAVQPLARRPSAMALERSRAVEEDDHELRRNRFHIRSPSLTCR